MNMTVIMEMNSGDRCPQLNYASPSFFRHNYGWTAPMSKSESDMGNNRTAPPAD